MTFLQERRLPTTVKRLTSVERSLRHTVTVHVRLGSLVGKVLVATSTTETMAATTSLRALSFASLSVVEETVGSPLERRYNESPCRRVAFVTGGLPLLGVVSKRVGECPPPRESGALVTLAKTYTLSLSPSGTRSSG